MWLCGYVAMWLCGYFELCASRPVSRYFGDSGISRFLRLWNINQPIWDYFSFLGTTLGILFEILKLFWEYFEIILGSFGDHSGILLGSFWKHSGIILGSFWEHFGIILGSFGDHFGIIFLNHFGIILGSFSALFCNFVHRPGPPYISLGVLVSH